MFLQLPGGIRPSWSCCDWMLLWGPCRAPPRQLGPLSSTPQGKDRFRPEGAHSWCPALLGLGFRVPHLDTECHEDIKWPLTVHGDFSLLNRGGHTRKPRFSSVQFSLSVRSDAVRPRESQHARPPRPSPTPGVYSDSCPSSR